MAFVRKEDPESTRGFIVAAERDKPLRVFVLFYVCMASTPDVGMRMRTPPPPPPLWRVQPTKAWIFWRRTCRTVGLMNVGTWNRVSRREQIVKNKCVRYN